MFDERRAVSPEHNRPTPLLSNGSTLKAMQPRYPPSRNPCPNSSGEVIPVYPVRGADASRGGAAGSKSAPKWADWGVSAMTNQDNNDHEGDGVDRRGFLKCMAWAGTGLVWSVSGGVLSSRVFGQATGPIRGRELLVRPDQRQPHRLRQGAEQGRDRHAPGDRRQDQCAAGATGPADPHRRPHPPLDTQGVRHRRRDPQGGQGRADRLRARRARHYRRFEVPRAIRRRGPRGTAGTASTTTACISSAWSTSRARGPTKGLGILGPEQLDWLKADLAATGG